MKKGLILLGVILLGLGVLWFFVSPKKEVKEEEKIIPQTITPSLEKGGEERVKVLMVVAPKDFRDEELFETKKVLEEKGIEVEIASKGISEAQGVLGGKIAVDKDLAEARVEDYDGVVFVGGSGSSVYFDDQKAQSLAKEAFQNGKVVGAICIAPSILANAGILQGKKATSFSSEAGNLRSKGAEYTGEGVTVDGKIVTAQGPDDATQFGQELARALSGGD